MTTPLALFNGSYLSRKPTGIGVVARDLVAALDPALVPLLDPLGGDRPGSLPIPATLSPEHGRKGHGARLLWTQNQLPRLLRASGATLLLSPLPEAPLLQGVRSVVLAHDLLPLRHPQFTPLLAYHLAYVPLVLHRAVRVLCNSEATAREVHGRLGVPLRRLVPIRLGFDPGLLRPLGLDRQPFFLVLGRHDPHKNLARVLRAFAAVPDPWGELRLKVVGPHDTRYTPGLRHLAEALGIGSRCDWVAWVSDQERLELLNRCQALVVASLWEGFGLPALEGMACGAPVIAARAGALPEVVGEAALLVDPRREGELCSAMKRIQREGSLRRSLTKAGPARASLFRWDETARQVTALLRDCA
ncbi:MAG: glycosyltransferase family 1 protein [Cyanobacteriota bacterium]|nr:glycosyltransferase family 1 protein [Cyanobacteriota bacterium]